MFGICGVGVDEETVHWIPEPHVHVHHSAAHTQEAEQAQDGTMADVVYRSLR